MTFSYLSLAKAMYEQSEYYKNHKQLVIITHHLVTCFAMKNNKLVQMFSVLITSIVFSFLALSTSYALASSSEITGTIIDSNASIVEDGTEQIVQNLKLPTALSLPHSFYNYSNSFDSDLRNFDNDNDFEYGMTTKMECVNGDCEYTRIPLYNTSHRNNLQDDSQFREIKENSRKMKQETDEINQMLKNRFENLMR